MFAKLIAWALKFVSSGLLESAAKILDASQRTAVEAERTKAQVASELARTMASESQAKANVSIAQIGANWWWLQLPFMIIGMSTAIYWAAIMGDSLGWFSDTYDVLALPEYMKPWLGQIVLGIAGVSGAASLISTVIRSKR
jgi:hypothetical protein